MESKHTKDSILGVDVSVVRISQVLNFIEESITKKKRVYICVAAVHLIMESQHDLRIFNGVNRADLVVPDGMPLVWILKAAGHSNVSRVYGPDLMLKACRLAVERNYSVFFLGGAKGQSKQLARVLVSRFPALKIAGIYDTPIRPIPDKENNKVIKQINNVQPRIAFLGMGCPNQELWMIENREKLKVPVLIGVGAAFDIIIGKVPQAPTWMQKAGFEWLFRFAHEPKRLWKRYTLVNAKFVFLLIKSLLFGAKMR